METYLWLSVKENNRGRKEGFMGSQKLYSRSEWLVETP